MGEHRVRATTKDFIAAVPGTVAGLAVTVAAVAWAYGKWGLIGGGAALLIAPETVGYWSYMLVALAARSLLAVVPTTGGRPDATGPPLVASDAFMGALLLNVPHGPGWLAEYSDGSWIFTYASGMADHYENPLQLFVGQKRQGNGDLHIVMPPGALTWLRIDAANVPNWLARSQVLSALPADFDGPAGPG